MIVEFKVTSDETNNPPEKIKDNILTVDVDIKLEYPPKLELSFLEEMSKEDYYKYMNEWRNVCKGKDNED